MKISKMQIARNLQGISQTELGIRAGLPQNVISRLERGGINKANIQTAIRIAKALGVSVEEILDDTEV